MGGIGILQSVSRFLRSMSFPYWLPFTRLSHSLYSSNPEEVQEAARAIAHLGKQIVPTLVRWQEEEGAPACHAAHVAAFLPDERLVPGLIRTLYSPFEDGQIAAFHALEKIPVGRAPAECARFRRDREQLLRTRLFFIDFVEAKVDGSLVAYPLHLAPVRSWDAFFDSFLGYMVRSEAGGPSSVPVAMTRDKKHLWQPTEKIYGILPDDRPSWKPPPCHTTLIGDRRMVVKWEAGNRLVMRLSLDDDAEDGSSRDGSTGRELLEHYPLPWFIVSKPDVQVREIPVLVEMQLTSWGDFPDILGTEAWQKGRDRPGFYADVDAGLQTILTTAREFAPDTGDLLPFDECDGMPGVQGVLKLKHKMAPHLFEAVMYVAGIHGVQVGTTLSRTLSWREFFPDAKGQNKKRFTERFLVKERANLATVRKMLPKARGNRFGVKAGRLTA